VPGVTVCPICRVNLTPDAASTPPLAPREGGTQIDIAPILAEALAARQPGEDLDEALLRALKARHPEHAASLLSAVTRVLELQSQRSGETKDQAASRLAQQDSGLHINFKWGGGPVGPPHRFSGSASGGPGDHTFQTSSSTTSTTVINIGGKEYHSLEEVPTHLRPMIERAIGRATPPTPTTKRVGCSVGLLALPLLLLAPLLHR
jgi:hypothetical protein